jgi:hypothetical protein
MAGAERDEQGGAPTESPSIVTDQKPVGVPRAGGRKPSSVLVLVVLVDLLVIVPYSYWRLHDHRPVLIAVYAVQGIALLTLLGIALHLRRRGT